MESEFITIKTSEVIQFVNTVNEICKTIDDEFVGEWLTTHHAFLNKRPL